MVTTKRTPTVSCHSEFGAGLSDKAFSGLGKSISKKESPRLSITSGTRCDQNRIALSSRLGSKSPCKTAQFFPVGYMRLFLPVYVLLCLSLGVASAEELPQFRPALLGSGPNSLVNLIDLDALMKQGQRNAVVRFHCIIAGTGSGYGARVYRATPGSTALKKEILFKAQTRARFIPAIYKQGNQYVIMYGTVVFFVTNGKPHLRIYLNQEDEDVKRGNDFVGPQLVIRENKSFTGFIYPYRARTKSPHGIVMVRLNISANGEITDAKLVSESPPNFGFADEIMKTVRDVLFIPGYRNGKPVACTVDYPFFFGGKDDSTRSVEW